MPLEGLQIGRYRLKRKLGSGGMGEVYLAEDARIGQQVAIKVIQSEASPYANANTTIQSTRLFQREAMAIARLDHPHILPLFDYGEISSNGTTLSYLVMPFRQEGSLIDWLARRSSSELLSLQDVAHIVSQTAEALQHSHDRQIIHQDVKPSNLLIREIKETSNRPDVLLADFGIAKFTTANAASSQVIRGTPSYMAPEQWAGRPVPATDQYALAVMAYALLTSRLPFQGSSLQVMYQHLNVQPQAPSTLNSELSAAVDAVLLHALAKEPSQRFASVTAFAQALRQSVQYDGIARSLKMPGATNPASPSQEGDVYAVLAISEAEARQGTTRSLNLPGGRKVIVSVPAGTHDGHLLRLEGQGEQLDPGSPPGALMIFIEVKQANKASPTSNATGTEPTISLAHSADQASGKAEASQTVAASGAPAPVGASSQLMSAAKSAIDPARDTPPTTLVGGSGGEGSHRSTWRWWLPVATALVALLLIIGGVTFAVASGFISLSNGLRIDPSQVTPAPIHLTPKSIPPTRGSTHHPTPGPVYPTPTPIPPTPTPLPSPTPAPLPSPTPTPAPLPSPTPTPAPPPSPTPTPAPPPSPTPTPAPPPSPTPTPAPPLSPTPTTAPSPPPSPTSSLSPTPSPSLSPTPSSSLSPTPSLSSSPTPSLSSSPTP